MVPNTGAAWLRSVLRVVKTFAENSPSQTAAQVASRSRMSELDAHERLLALVGAGLARMDGQRFLLTPVALDGAFAFLSSRPELNVISRALADLSRQVGQAAAAALLDDREIVVVASALSQDSSVAAEVILGRRRPAHVTAAGQVLLAQLSPEELDRFLVGAGREVFTDETLIGRDDLSERLDQVRREGYAIASRELTDQLRTIAVPVPPSVIGYGLAISILAPAVEMTVQQARDYLPTLNRTVRAVADEIRRLNSPAQPSDGLLWA